MSYTQEQFNKLPKWVRDEITVANRNAEFWKNKFYDTQVKREDAKLFLDMGWDGDKRNIFSLPDCPVTFRVGGQEVYIYREIVSGRAERLSVRSQRDLVVVPCAHNSLELFTVEVEKVVEQKGSGV